MKKRFLFVMATVLILSMSMVTMISGCGCQSTVTNSTADEASTTATSIETVTEIATDEQGNTYIEEATEIVELKADNANSDSEKEEKNDSSTSKTKTSSSSSSTNKTNSSSSNSSKSNSSSSMNNSNSSNNSSSNKSSSSSNSSSSSSISSNEETKHNHSWENITKKIKVIDQEAYSYEEPVYEEQDRTICNECGADVTENLIPHMKNHILNDENGSYRNEWIEVKVGTKTVEVPEQFHYENKTIGRKCSSCGATEYY